MGQVHGFTTYFMGKRRISSPLQKDTFTELKLTSCALYKTIDEEKVSGRVVRTDIKIWWCFLRFAAGGHHRPVGSMFPITTLPHWVPSPSMFPITICSLPLFRINEASINPVCYYRPPSRRSLITMSLSPESGHTPS